MKKKLLLACGFLALYGAAGAQETTSWEAPTVPGVDIAETTFSSSDIYYLYNVKADAFATYGMKWGTQALASRLYNGDTSASNGHYVYVTKSDELLKFSISVSGTAKTYLGVASYDAADVWADYGSNNQWDYAETEEGSNAYTLNVTGQSDYVLDTYWEWGGPLIAASSNGKGNTEWAIISSSSITDGSYALYKAKKLLYGIYEAMNDDARSTYSDALATAYTTYSATDVDADSVEAAAKTLLTAVASGVSEQIDASFLFTNADMSGAASVSDWTETSRSIEYGEFEAWEVQITLSQTQTNLPNGKYSVVFHSFYRQESGSEDAPTLTLTSGESSSSANIPLSTSIAWGVSSNGYGGWTANSNTNPNNMLSAAQALCYEGAAAEVAEFVVSNGELTITVAEENSYQWFNWQGLEIYYEYLSEDETLTALYEQVQEIIETLNSYSSDSLNEAILDEIDEYVASAGELTEKSDQESLEDAVTNGTTLIKEAEAMPEAYVSVLELIETCNTYAENSEEVTEGATETFESAIETAEANVETVTSAESLTAIEETLEAARQEFVKNAAPINDISFDATFLIDNHSFETGDFTSWTNSGMSTQANGSFGEVDGTYYVESWVSNGNDVSDCYVQQALSLSSGVYTLTAAAQNIDQANTSTAQTGAYIFAGSNAVELYEAAAADYSISFRTAGTSTVTVGFKTENATGNWVACDNFRLYKTAGWDADYESLYETYMNSDSLNTAVKDSLTRAYEAYTEAIEGNYESTYTDSATFDPGTVNIDGLGDVLLSPITIVKTDSTTEDGNPYYTVTIDSIGVCISNNWIYIPVGDFTGLEGTTANDVTTVTGSGSVSVDVGELLTNSAGWMIMSLTIDLDIDFTADEYYAEITIEGLGTLMSLFDASISSDDLTITAGSPVTGYDAATAFEEVLAFADEFKANAYDDYVGTLELIEICTTYSENSTLSEGDEEQTTFTAAIATATTDVEAALNEEEVQAVEETLEAARQEYVLNAYPTNDVEFDATFLFDNSSSSWGTGYETFTGYSYVEDYTGSYYTGEVTSQSQEVPNGYYKVTVSVAASQAWQSEAAVEDGTDSCVVLYANDSTIAIPVYNRTTISADDMISYTLDSVMVVNDTLTIGLEILYESANWFVMNIDSVLLIGEPDASVYYAQLQTLIAEADTLTTNKVNVGEAALQIPTSAVTTLENASTTAKSYTETSTEDELKAAVETLQAALDAYYAAELNVPETRVKVIMNESGYNYNTYAWTNIPSTTTLGNYDLNWYENTDYYAQALTFEAVEDSVNTYIISYVDADETAHYLCTGAALGSTVSWNSEQLRLTTVKDSALYVKVNVSYTMEGVWNLLNTVANTNIGSNGNSSVYTSNGYDNLTIAEAAEDTITRTLSLGNWLTLIVPFNYDVPEGWTVYGIDSIAADEEDTETEYAYLTSVESIAANTPYVVYMDEAGSATLSGYGHATTTSYDNGYLTGVYDTTTVAQGNYVLQNQTDKDGEAFYKVSTDDIVLNPYRVYMNATTSSEETTSEANVRLLVLPGDEDNLTGIASATAAEDIDGNTLVNVYSLNGILVRSNVKLSEATEGLQRGVYIVNGVKKAVK